MAPTLLGAGCAAEPQAPRLPAACLDAPRIPAAQACLDATFRDAVASGATRDAILQLSQAVQDGRVDDCHLLVHALGWAAFRATQNVPAAFRLGNERCLNGYYHGVIEEALILHPSARTNPAALCAGTNAPLTPACVHGAGHGLLHVADGDVARALADCRAFGPDQTPVCLDGVLMEVTVRFLGLEPDAFADRVAHACDGWGLDAQERDACLMNVGEAAMFYHHHDLDQAYPVCDRFAGIDRDQCRHGVRDEADNAALQRQGR